VLAQGELAAHQISEPDICQRMDELAGAIQSEAEPFDCLMNLNRAVYLHARDRNVRALLDGVDGDVLLSDSFCLPPLWQRGAFRTIIGETLRADGLTAEYKMGRKLFLSGLLSTVTSLAPKGLRQGYRQRATRKRAASARDGSLIAPEFADRSCLAERFAELNSYRILTERNQVAAHKLDLEHPNIAAGLERYERVASSFGVEARHPLLDIRLAEFCLGLPWQLKTQHGWTKMILRRAMEPDLPPDVIWRRDKDSLMWEVNRLVLKERADYFYQVTRDERASLQPYIDMQKLMGFWQAYLTRGDEKEAESLWAGAALALWLRGQRSLR
jgi:hypothetical protein